MRNSRRSRSALVAVCAVSALFAGTAGRAAGAVGSSYYTVTPTSGLYEAPPVDALTFAGPAYSGRVDFPFDFAYFGVVYDHANVNVGSLLLFGNDTGSVQTNSSDPATVTSGAVVDGACAPFWCPLALASLPNIKRWTAGTAPNRRVIVSWENCSPYTGGPATLTFQVKLFEGTNRIEFAYKNDSIPTTWANVTYSSGLVAPGVDTRWVAPVNTLTTNTGHPPNDYRFDPRTITISGKALYDRLTPTAAGLGTATTQAPLARLDLDLLFTDGRRFARSSTDANGDFQIITPAGPAGAAVDVYAYTQGTACVVKAPAAPTAFVQKLAANVTSTSDTNVGTKLVDAAADPNAQFRGPANVAIAIQRARDWMAARTATTIPKLAVSYDFALTTATGYASSPAPALTVAGPAATNPDTWDDAVLARTYARFVLPLLVGATGSQTPDTFDAATDDENAFAVAFGHFLAAAVTGQRVFVDATSTSTAVSYDLEDPQPVTAKATNVAAWNAAALYDLLDAANEPSDTVDGTNGAADRVVQAVDALTSAATSTKFFESWNSLGFDGLGISRAWIADGLLADDANEANDSAGESALLGPLGTRRDGLTLNIGNEDWFDVTIPALTDVVVAEVAFPRVATPAAIELEFLTAAGVRLADKVDNSQSAVAVSAGPLAAGTYRLRVVHVSGKRVPAYTIQASRRLAMDHTPLLSWTAGMPYAQTIAVTGGIGATSFSVPTGTAPVGLLFDAGNQRAAGSPVQPGAFDFTLAVADSGNPQHTDQTSYHVVISAALGFDLGEFVPFALGKAVDAVRPHVGGTQPLTVSTAAGAMPDGITLAANDLRFSGTPGTAGATTATIHVVDFAGSAHEADVTSVVCVPLPAAKSPADLAAGQSACGFFVDGVAGSSLKFSASTASKRAKRALRAVLLAPDGSAVAGAVAKPGTGKASVALSSLPVTGRYFVVIASDAGDATQILGSAGVVAPKGAKGSFDGVKGGDVVVFEFGALAGAKLSVKATPEKASALSLNVLALIGPNGIAVPLTDIASQKGTSAVLGTTLALSGTWTVRVRATGSNVGKVAYSVKLAEPKGGTFSAD